MPGHLQPGRWQRFSRSIFTRVILIGVAVVVFGSLTRIYVLTHFLRESTQVSVQAQQQALADDLARALQSAIQSKSDPLATLRGLRNGMGGGYLLLAPQQRLWATSTDAVPALRALPTGGQIALLDGVLSAMADPTQTQPKGAPLWAPAVVPGSAWVVVAYLPAEEAFAVVTSTIQVVLYSLPVVVSVYLLLAGTGLYFTLRPLSRAARHADRMTHGELPLEPLPIDYQDEVGDLTAAFNRLLEKLTEQSRELTTQKEIAESATQAKSRFLAAASHDLRQPMHALNLYLGALAGLDLPHAAQPALHAVRTCAQTMDEMFRALLDISTLDASVLRAEPFLFPIATLLNKIHLEFVPQAHAKGLKMRTAPCAAIVWSDPELLERVLRNLVSNAVRYTARGQILLGCRRVGATLRIGVYDTGCGIAADQQRAVFEEFYQLGNPERDRAQGLGLGLAIVQRLAALLQTPLTLQSEPGRGSVFAVTVRAVAPGPPLPRPAQPHAATPEQMSLHGALVAVIDDEAAVLQATRTLLEHWGCMVVTASSAQDLMAHALLNARRPDVLVCDYRLRGQEAGDVVVQTLRGEFNWDIPALLVTGDSSPHCIRQLRATGLTVLHKPVRDDKLYAVLQDLLWHTLQA